MSKTAIYRHFDADGCLLYVGITNYLPARTAQHRKNSNWFSSVASTTVQWVDSREYAAALELLAIQFERPKHNCAGLSQVETGNDDALRAAVTADGRSWRAISLAAGLGPNFLQQVFTGGKDPGTAKVMKVMAVLRNQPSSLSEAA